MADNRRPKAVASTVKSAKKADAKQRGKALRRAAKALGKASAREKKAQGNLDKGNRQLDTALLTLEKTAVGSPKARQIEAAARAALKELLVQRKKLRRARKALLRAEAKERKAKDRAAGAAAKEARTKKPAAQTRMVSWKPPAKTQKKHRAEARAKSVATKPNVMDTMPAAEAVSGVDGGGLPESAAASRASTPRRELE